MSRFFVFVLSWKGFSVTGGEQFTKTAYYDVGNKNIVRILLISDCYVQNMAKICINNAKINL